MENTDNYDDLSWEELDQRKSTKAMIPDYKASNLNKVKEDKQARPVVPPLKARDVIGPLTARLKEGSVPSEKYFCETGTKTKSYRERGLSTALGKTLSQLTLCTGMA